MPGIPTKLSSNLHFACHFTFLLCKDANHSDVTFELLLGKLYMYQFGIWDWLLLPLHYKGSNRKAHFSYKILLHTITPPSRLHCFFRQSASSLSLPEFFWLFLWRKNKQKLPYKLSTKTKFGSLLWFWPLHVHSLGHGRGRHRQTQI